MRAFSDRLHLDAGPPAGRRRGRHRAVELPVHHGDLEARPGAGGRQHDRAQAGAADAVARRSGSPSSRSRPGCRRACSTSSPVAPRSAQALVDAPRRRRWSRSRVRPGAGRAVMSAARRAHQAACTSSSAARRRRWCSPTPTSPPSAQGAGHGGDVQLRAGLHRRHPRLRRAARRTTRFVDSLAEQMRRDPGRRPPTTPTPTSARSIAATHRDRVHGFVDPRGRRRCHGRHRWGGPDGPGAYYPPTLVTGARAGLRDRAGRGVRSGPRRAAVRRRGRGGRAGQRQRLRPRVVGLDRRRAARPARRAPASRPASPGSTTTCRSPPRRRTAGSRPAASART